jgi:hypothetical protein
MASEASLKMSDLSEFKEELHQDIMLDSAIAELYPEESFFDLMSSTLNEAGIVDDMEYAPFRDTRKGIKIDGYSWNELERVFCGVIVDLSDDPQDVSSISKTEIEALGKRVSRYLDLATTKKFRDSLDVSSIGRGTGDFLAHVKDQILKYRVIVITDSLISDRVKKISIDSIDDKKTSIEIWDLERLMKLSQSAHETEEFVVDLSNTKQPVQVIEASRLDNDTVTYMGVMPASVLFNIYEEFGQRLLESNVRTFLDFRAGPNKSMRQGLMLEPEKFFSYNNGLTITATSAKIIEIGGRLVVHSLDNMQIVNGGQTTATIYFTPNEPGGLDTASGKLLYRDVQLDKVSVQMKLTVMNGDDAEFSNTYKANISRYANFQTAVNAGDLTSNSPFHKDIERLSRKTSMPLGGEGYPTKWFYERARGQYSTKKRGLGLSEVRKFMMEYPKAQVFTKDLLNKYEVTWQMQPHIVKKGTTPARNYLMAQIKKKYEDNPSYRLEADYFQDIVAKMILFKQVDKAVLKSTWYQLETGLKAEAVTYAIPLVRKRLIDQGKDINLSYIYQNQAISPALTAVIVESAGVIRANIMSSQFRAGSGNVSEFCRNENGWKRIQMVDIDISGLGYPDIIDGEDIKKAEESKEAIADASAQMTDFDQIMAISDIEWQKLASYNLKSFRLESPEVKLPSMCAQLHRGGRMLTDKQLTFVLKIYRSSKERGFEFGSVS